MTALGRVARRVLLLGGGVVAGWLLSAVLHAPAAAATPVPVRPAPTGGLLRPLLAPIQGPPTGTNPPGVLLITPAVHRLAEPAGTLLATVSGTAARAVMAFPPGSVPGSRSPAGSKAR